MKLSVIIPSIGACIDNLRNLLRIISSQVHEIIIVADDRLGLLREASKEFSNTKVIANSRSKGFNGSVNTGLLATRGDLIFLVNDDVVVTENTIVLFKKFFKDSRFFVAGPITNYGLDVQTIKENLTPENIRKLESSREDFVRVAAVSGFFMVFPRYVFDKVGLFDEQFSPGGAEDIDFCVRARAAGIDAVVLKNVPVYHEGGVSFNSKNFNYVIQLVKLYDKYQVTKRQVLVGVMRVKDDYDYLQNSIPRLRSVCDKVVVLDDHSTDSRVKDFVRSQKCVYVPAKSNDEVSQRNYLIEVARNEGADWILSMDADEVLEERLSRPVLDFLMQTPNPLILGYNFKIRTFWRGGDSFRCDGVWGNLGGTRLFKVDRVQWCTPHPDGMHCVPNLPLGSTRYTGYSFKHYGYDSIAKCWRKYHYYTAVDKHKDVRLIGTPDYYHLVDESTIQLRPWIENNTHSLMVNVRDDLDVITLLDQVRYCFDEVVLGVDSRSRYIREFAKLTELFRMKMVIVKFQDDFSKLRNEVLKHCTCKWVTVLDPDERVDPSKLVDMIYTHSDAVLYRVLNFLKGNRVSVSYNPRTFRNHVGIKFTGRCHETVEDSLKGRRIDESITDLLHFGFLKPHLPEKLQLYFRLNKMAMEENPDDPRPYFNLALHYIENGDDETATELLLKSVSLKKDFKSAWVSLANIFLRKACTIYKSLLEQGLGDEGIKKRYDMIKDIAKVEKVLTEK